MGRIVTQPFACPNHSVKSFRCCITQRVPGARTQAAAHAVVHELHGRLASGCLPVETSDGLNQYFYALTAHFGQWGARVGRRARRWLLAAGLIYGQVKKRYRRRLGLAEVGKAEANGLYWGPAGSDTNRMGRMQVT
jgi:hypothetical protein